MGMSGGSNRATREAEAQERQRQEAIRTGTERVRSTFSAPERQAQIADFIAATRGLGTKELNRQQAEATRGNRFALARSGQLGGSLQVDRSRRLGESYGRGLLEVERRAQRRQERYRLKQQAKIAAAEAAGKTRVDAEAQTRAITRLMTEHDSVDGRWFAYETDVVALLEFPMMTNMREPLTVAFHRARREADSLRPSAARGPSTLAS